MSTKSILIVAGGTGGHVFPGLAVASELSGMNHEIVWLGTEAGIEAKLVPAAGIALFFINIKGIRGKGLKDIAIAPYRILKSIIQSMKLIKRIKPEVMLCMGGFVSGPAGIAAKLMRVPLVIHEQNAIAGTTNYWLSKVADLNLQAFPGALNKHAVTVGNPVRDTIKEMKATARENPDKLNVLVIGGSLGAKAINEIMPKVYAQMSDEINLWHQVGEKNYDDIKTAYDGDLLDEQLKISAFIENMAEAYDWADIVICRAGAMTVSEIAVAAKPAIFIPFPFAIDDHQTANAKWLSESNAAYLLPQNEMTLEKMISLLRDLQNDRKKLSELGRNARQLAIFDATERVAKKCLEVAL